MKPFQFIVIKYGFCEQVVVFPKLNALSALPPDQAPIFFLFAEDLHLRILNALII